jgi:hypothetical protein
MEEKKELVKEKGRVSRRDFLTGLGASAIGTAIISTRLLNPDQAEVHAAQSASKVPIALNMKKGEWWEDIDKGMRTILEKEFGAFGAKQLNLRLNESGAEKPSPVWIDWVGLPAIETKLQEQSTSLKKQSPGDLRLGDTTPAKLYDDAFNNAPKKVEERDWCSQSGHLLAEKKVESKLLAQKAGIMYQTTIGIIAQQDKKRLCVGTFAVGFEKKPNAGTLKKVQVKMKELAKWSQNSKSSLVDVIENHFVLGGRPV